MQGAEKKERKRALDNVVVALLDADLFYFVFLQIPRIHAAKFQLLDRSTRNAKWITIKAGRRWRGKEEYNYSDMYLCGRIISPRDYVDEACIT